MERERGERQKGREEESNAHTYKSDSHLLQCHIYTGVTCLQHNNTRKHIDYIYIYMLTHKPVLQLLLLHP